MLTDIYKNKWNISTHSLTKRLTIDWWTDGNISIHFNSQPHEEADGWWHTDIVCGIIFQLTASRRGWRDRTYERNSFQGISTHSLTKRLTPSNSPLSSLSFISTHSLTKRLTIIFIHFNETVNISTHSLTKRLTMDDNVQKNLDSVFQLTASRRGWRQRAK